MELHCSQVPAPHLWTVRTCLMAASTFCCAEYDAPVVYIRGCCDAGCPEPAVGLERNSKRLTQVRQCKPLCHAEGALGQTAAPTAPQSSTQQEDLVLTLECSCNGAPASTHTMICKCHSQMRSINSQ